MTERIEDVHDEVEKKELSRMLKKRMRLGLFEILAVFTVVVIGSIFFASNLGWLTPLSTTFDQQFGEGSFQKMEHWLNVYVFTLALYIIITTMALRIWRRILAMMYDQVSTSVIITLTTVGRLVIISIAAVAYLNSFSEFSGFLIAFGAVFGTALGFASSNTVTNLISGLYIMVARPYVIGDYIGLPDMNAEGVIREITINYTRIKKPDGTRILVPNSKMMKQNIFNMKVIRTVSSTRGTTSKKVYYRYPQNWGIKTEWSHKAAVAALELTAKEFEKRLVEPVGWTVIKQDHGIRIYEIRLVVDKADTLLDITTDYLTRLSENFEEVKAKY